MKPENHKLWRSVARWILEPVLVIAGKMPGSRNSDWFGRRCLKAFYLFFEPLCLGLLLVYKLAQLRVLRFQNFYLQKRSRQLLSQYSVHRKILNNIQDDAHAGESGEATGL